MYRIQTPVLELNRDASSPVSVASMFSGFAVQEWPHDCSTQEQNGGGNVEPLAIVLYRRYLNGASVKQLSRELDIPSERIERRIRAAADHLQKHTEERRAA